jgi:hypothetical protein
MPMYALQPDTASWSVHTVRSRWCGILVELIETMGDGSRKQVGPLLLNKRVDIAHGVALIQRIAKDVVVLRQQQCHLLLPIASKIDRHVVRGAAGERADATWRRQHTDDATRCCKERSG